MRHSDTYVGMFLILPSALAVLRQRGVRVPSEPLQAAADV